MSEQWHKPSFTTGEAARLCGVSQQTIIRCFDAGRLSGFKVPGSKFRRIPRQELLRFMRENGIPTEAIEPPGRRILIVDDDIDMLQSIRDIVAGQGPCEIRTASTGYEAGLLTAQFQPDLILLDYLLPDVNGDVVCARLRNDPTLSKTRVIFVSGAIAREEHARLMSSGADALITKPFTSEQLRAALDRVMGSWKARRAS